MRTPSLRRRVTVSGVVVFIVLVLLLDGFVYLTLRARLEVTLDEVLATRVELVAGLAELVDDGAELAERLGARGIPAVVTTADGQRISSGALPRFDINPPGSPDLPPDRKTTTLALDSGGSVEVSVSRAGVDETLRRVALVTLLGTAVAAIAALLLFRRSAEVAMGPLDEVVAAADRTAAGRTGERLDPDRPDTELGRFAVAYDAMLDSLEDALERTQRTEERTRRFVDDAAHQLRTPLATVRASVEALLREQDPEVRDLLYASLVREAARADRLLSALLLLARIEGDRTPDRTPTDIAALCRDEVARTGSRSPSIDLDLDIEGDPGRPAIDGETVREAVSNLLDNARRHAATRVEVTVRADRDAGVTVVTIRDDGDGVPEDRTERIFQRFASLDGRGGSGLGLPIARAIAENHGGSLTYEGGAFILTLPTDPTVQT
ncbi:MAG: HAMP domain-containing sensor histidine kinase [Nitriliruptor sp.]